MYCFDASLTHLLQTTKQLETIYRTEQHIKDINRLFGKILPYTTTFPYIEDCKFIQNLSSWISDHKFEYESNPALRYEQNIAPLLKNAILGSMLLLLIKIEMDPDSGNTLRSLLLDFFKIQQLRDIPTEISHQYLSALHRVFKKICERETANPWLPLTNWHPQLSNQALLELIASLYLEPNLEELPDENALNISFGT